MADTTQHKVSLAQLMYAPVAEALAQQLGVGVETIFPLLSQPTARGVVADVCFPCFQFSKAKGMAPPALAQELAKTLAGKPAIKSVSASGPFVNFCIESGTLAASVLPQLVNDPITCTLRSTVGCGKTATIDFSSPNIAKHLAFHHIRSTMIGNALSHLYSAAGWKVVRINFVGDWGTAFGRLISGWKREGLQLEQLEAAPDKVTFLNELYVRASNAAKDNEELEEDARRWSKKLEDGDEEARKLWQLFKDASLAEFKRVYQMLGVDFDSWRGEAYYEDKMGPILKELEEAKLLSEDKGATIVDLPALLGKKAFAKPALIKRQDGGTLYATRDMAACQDRFDTFHFDRSVYVVDLGQSLHFQEWFAIMKLLKKPFAQEVGTPQSKLRHVGFGVVLVWNEEDSCWGKTKSRNGKAMLLREVLEEAVERAAAVVAEKSKGLSAEEQAQVSKWVGIGAVVFNDLKNGRTGDVRFKLEDALKFDGETGPYLQYTHARLCSIERKFAAEFPAEVVSAPMDATLLGNDYEKAVLLSLSKMQPALEKSVDTDEPSVLASALLNLASVTSTWYSAGNTPELRILSPEYPAVTRARVALVHAIRVVLGEGIRMMGLVPPEAM